MHFCYGNVECRASINSVYTNLESNSFDINKSILDLSPQGGYCKIYPKYRLMNPPPSYPSTSVHQSFESFRIPVWKRVDRLTSFYTLATAFSGAKRITWSLCHSVTPSLRHAPPYNSKSYQSILTKLGRYISLGGWATLQGLIAKTAEGS